MSAIVVPARSPEDWRRLLADPKKHWQPGFSAHSLAHAWQPATTAPGGWPPEVRAVLAQDPALAGAEVILVRPEVITPLPGGGGGSHTDALVLARTDAGLVIVAVEAKVKESAGPTVARWLTDASDGKRRRLAAYLDLLGLSGVAEERLRALRYQFFHRAAAALLEAQRYHAREAVLLVHSFDSAGFGFDDFRAFAALLGVEARRSGVVRVGERGGVALALAWATGTATARVAAAVSRDPDVHGGAPVFAGSRVPVEVLRDHLIEGSGLDDFLTSHPGVTRADAEAVLVDAFAGLREARAPSARVEALVAHLQTLEAREALRVSLEATGEEMGQAALEAARRRGRGKSDAGT